jgi:hypothetical protein
MLHPTRTAFLAGIVGVVAGMTVHIACRDSFGATLSGPAKQGSAGAAVGAYDDAVDFKFDGTSSKQAGSPSRSDQRALAGTLPTPALMAEIVAWLSANFDLPTVDELPRVELVPVHRLGTLRLGELALRQSATAGSDPSRPSSNIGRDLIAIYDSSKRIVYLPEEWRGESPAETSILVHEMVHHLQDVGGVKYLCPDAREKLAYLAQDAWLQRFGQSLEATFEVDLFTVLVRSACFH